jgi:hypothetical protein
MRLSLPTSFWVSLLLGIGETVLTRASPPHLQSAATLWYQVWVSDHFTCESFVVVSGLWTIA